jgi:lipase chaperone LimK
MMRRRSLVDALFDSKLALGVASVAAVAIGVVGVVLWQRPAVAPDTAPTQAAANWDGAMGPGMLSGAVRDLPAIDAQLMRENKIAVDASGHLVPDRALRNLMDGFLLKGKQSERQAMETELRLFLRQSLRPPAAGEADRLVTDYLAYQQAEQQLLSSQRFTPPDAGGLSEEQVKQLLAWQHQRADLRQRMLGTAVASAWFDAEDGNCTAILNDWQKQLAPPDDNDSNEQFARRRYGDALEQRRNDNAQACAAQLMDTMAQRG